MAKLPKDVPTIGDRVELRGKSIFGVLCRMDDDFWSFVLWETTGPKICHAFELKKVEYQWHG